MKLFQKLEEVKEVKEMLCEPLCLCISYVEIDCL